MQRISLAPELSATLSRVSCWITCLLRLLHDLEHAPANLLGDAHLDDDGLVHLVGDDGAQANLALSARGFGGLDGLLVDRHQDFSSFALRTRLGLVAADASTTLGLCDSPPALRATSPRGGEATSSDASGSKPSSFTATPTGAVSCTGTGARPSSRSLITVMMRAMSWRTLAIWLEFSSWPTACLNRSS